jgi:hypothetical protein
MDHAPPAAEPDCPTEADTACRPARCPQCGAGPDWEMVERQKRNLAELGEIGMDLARQLQRQMRHSGIVTDQGSQMFDRISRAVRRAHALEAKVDADSRKTAAQLAAEWARQEAASQRAGASKPSQPPAAQAASKRESLLDDLRDRDDTLSDLRDLPDDDDQDDEDGGRVRTGEIAELTRTLAVLRRKLADRTARGKAADASAVAKPAPQAPGGDLLAHAALLACPPRATGAHDPPL